MIRKLMESFERVKEISADPNGKVFIRGAGYNGRILCRDLKALNIEVTAFLDENFEILCGGRERLISPDEAYRLPRGSYFILSSLGGYENYREVRREMEGLGLIEGEDFADFGLFIDGRMSADVVPFMDMEPVSYNRKVMDMIWGKMAISLAKDLCPGFVPKNEFWKEYNFFPNLNLPITTYCSLKCAKCITCNPHIKRPRHFSPECVITDMDKKCRQFDVPVWIHEPSTLWDDFGDFTQKRNYSRDELRHLYALCNTTQCNHLYDGKLYSCSRLAVLNEEHLIPYDSNAFFDIRAMPSHEAKDSLHGYMYRTSYFDGCQYCDGSYPYSKTVLRGE